MSPKKKPTPSKNTAPKDDLIDALLENESDGNLAFKNSQTKSETVSRLSEARRSPPPPPPPSSNDRNDPVYNFESDVTQPLAQLEVDDIGDDSMRKQTFSAVRAAKSDSVPTFEMPEEVRNGNFNLDDLKTTVAKIEDAESDYGKSISRVVEEAEDRSPSPPRASMNDSIRRRTVDLTSDQSGEKSISTPSMKVDDRAFEDRSDAGRTGPKHVWQPDGAPKAEEKPKGDKLQRLEDVLRKLKPQFDKKSDKPKQPLFDPDTQAQPVKPVLQSVQPPPAKPPGVVAKPILPDATPTPSDAQGERAPTEPVRTSIDPHLDEKTIAAMNTPSPVFKMDTNESPTPVWQDAKTEVISRMTNADNPDHDPEGEQFMPTEIRPNSPGAKFRENARQAQPGAAIFSSAEAALRQSENLRVAQKRISDLEHELERVRRENENLRSAGETLRRRMDELQSHAETAEMNTQEAKKIAEEERKVLRGQITSRDREISELKGRIDDAETRLESNFRKIRVRERDLEHRIEIIKAESQSIAASKDRMILELKRQIDQISSELNHAKTQVQETFGQFKEKQETARRAVRALRIALTVLEGEEDSGSRKAE